MSGADNSFSTAASLSTISTTLSSASSSNSSTFKPTSLISNTFTLNPRQVTFHDNVMMIAQFYEEHRHYSVPISNKKLYQWSKNMKYIIRCKKEGTVPSRRLTDSQYKILKDIKFVEYTVGLDKDRKQGAMTKAYRNILASIDSFKNQNGHTDLLRPDAKFIKTVKRSDGSISNTNGIISLQKAFKTLKNGKLGKERKSLLKEKGIDLDVNSTGGSDLRAEDSGIIASPRGNENIADVSTIESSVVQLESVQVPVMSEGSGLLEQQEAENEKGSRLHANVSVAINHEDERASFFEISNVGVSSKGQVLEDEDEAEIVNTSEDISLVDETGKKKNAQEINNDENMDEIGKNSKTNDNTANKMLVESEGMENGEELDKENKSLPTKTKTIDLKKKKESKRPKRRTALASKNKKSVKAVGHVSLRRSTRQRKK